MDLFLCGSDLILVFVAVDCFPKSSENIVSDRFDGWLVTLSNVSHLVIVTCWALSVLGYVCVGMCSCAALFPCETVSLVLRLRVVCVCFGSTRLLTFVEYMYRSGGYLGLLGRDSGCSGGSRGDEGELGVT